MTDPRLNFDVTADTVKAEQSLSKFRSFMKKTFSGKDISDPIEDGVNKAVKSYKKLDDESTKVIEKQKDLWTKLYSFLNIGLSVKVVDFMVDALKQIPDAIEDIIDKGASLQQFRATLTGLLGDPKQVEALNNELVKFARQTPFNIIEMRQSAQGLLGVGYAAGDIIPIMTKLGNIAAVVGKERLPSFIEAYTQVTAKGVVNLQQLRRFQTAGVNIYEELENVLGVSQKRMFQMLRANQVTFQDFDKALENLTTGTGKYAKGLSAVQDSWYIVTSNIKDQAENIFGNIGQVIIEQITPSLRNFSDAFNKIDASSFSSKIVIPLNTIADLMATISYGAIAFPNKVIDGYQLMWKGFGVAVSKMQVYWEEFILFLQQKAENIPFYKKIFGDVAEQTKKNIELAKQNYEKYSKDFEETKNRIEADTERREANFQRGKAERQLALLKAIQRGKDTKLKEDRKIINDEEIEDEKKKAQKIYSIEKELLYDIINQQANKFEWSYKTFDKYWNDLISGYRSFYTKIKGIINTGQPKVNSVIQIFPTDEENKEDIKRIQNNLEMLNKSAKEGNFWAELFSVDDATKAINVVTKLSKDASASILENLSKNLAPSPISGFITGFGTTLVEMAIKAIFGGNGSYKSISDYAQESFDKMVKNTNDALDSIGKEKGAVERKIGILETVSQAGTKTISEGLALQLGEPGIAGMTIEQGKNYFRQQQIGLSEKEISTAQQGIQSLIGQKKSLETDLEYYRKKTEGGYYKHVGDPFYNSYLIAQYQTEKALETINLGISEQQLKFNQETYLENLAEMYSLQNQITPYVPPVTVEQKTPEEIAREEERVEELNISSLQDKLRLAKEIKDKGLTPTSDQYSALGFAEGTPIDTIINTLTGNVSSAISGAKYYNPVQKQSYLLDYIPSLQSSGSVSQSSGSVSASGSSSGTININIQGNVMNIDDTAMSINEALSRLAKQGRTI